MEVAVLGPLRVVVAGQRVEIRRARERAVLTLLAAQPGEAVSAAVLIEGLWGAAPPATAGKTLQTYVHRLRRLLPNGAINTEAAGYRLAVDPAQVDAVRFEADVTALLDDRDLPPEQRAARLTTVLGSWRGTPFADADSALTLDGARARLEDLRLQAEAASLDARVQSGRHREALAELRSLLDRHPLREDIWATYTLALYRGGRQADALGALASARRVLAEELGVEPGPELHSLQERVLAQDPGLLDAPRPAGDPVDGGEPGADARPPPAEPEHRLATVLLATVAGGETLPSAVGADAAARVATEAAAAITAVVEEMNGTVVERGEWRVVAAFGVPVARDDDAYRAIRAALAVAETGAATGHEVARVWPGAAITVRVAVTPRSVTLPLDATALTDAVAEVESGLARTEPGTVLVADRIRTLTEDLFDWGGAARIDAGEDRTPTQMWPVQAAREQPDKARLGRRLRAPLIGRDVELGDADQVLEALGQGIGGLLLVSGDAGVGKTRLVGELRDGHGDHLSWLVGHCASYAEATPYWPFRDLLRGWLELGLDPPDLKTRVALHRHLEVLFGARATDLYPYLGTVLGSTLEPDQARRLRLAPEALQYRTFEAMTTLVEALARQRPLVIVIEDVHWADPTSIQLIEQLLPLTERAALLLVLTSRLDPDHPSARITETARRRMPHLTRELALTSLDVDSEQAMLEALVGADTLPVPTRRQILGLAEGNPFYLEELVGALVDAGALVSTDPGWAFDHDIAVTVPETVETVVQARIDRLGRPAHDLLTAASALGRSFSLPLLQGVLRERHGVVDSLNDLLRLGLLVETQRWPESAYAFKHALIQEAAYRVLPQIRRQRLHRLAAEWLEDRHRANLAEVAGLLARHWEAAGDDRRAIPALLRAGGLARREHALDEAILHYRRLLLILERRGDRATTAIVLFRLALSLHTALRFADANRVYQLAFAAWEPPAAPPATTTLRCGGLPFFDVPDPVRSYKLCDIMLQMCLFDRLVERWPDDTIVPSLAEQWEISDDGLRYTFRLREGLVWSDGRPITAGDVEYGLKRNLDPDRPGMSVSLLYVFEGAQDFVHRRLDDHRRIGVRALDDRTVEFRLAAPAPYLMGMLNRPDCGPQPRHSIERHGDDWGALEHEVVSGAFRRLAHTDEQVVLERRPGYQGTRTGDVRRVEWHLGPLDENLARFEAGKLDLTWAPNLSPGSRSTASQVGPPAGTNFLVFDHRKPLLRTPALRLALAHGIDRAGLPAYDTPATGGLVPPALAGHTPDIAPRHDPARGRDLLASVNLDRPLRIAALDDADHEDTVIAQALAEMWREHLGMECDVVRLDPTAYYAHDFGDLDLSLNGWYPGYMDPEYFLRLLLHSEAADNLGGFTNREFDALVERARSERDERNRLALYHRADRLAVAELAAVIPISYGSVRILRRPGLKGWWEFGKSWANFADLTLT